MSIVSLRVLFGQKISSCSRYLRHRIQWAIDKNWVLAQITQFLLNGLTTRNCGIFCRFLFASKYLRVIKTHHDTKIYRYWGSPSEVIAPNSLGVLKLGLSTVTILISSCEPSPEESEVEFAIIGKFSS
jgi:hypothetical protein